MRERLKALRVNEPLKLNGKLREPNSEMEVPRSEAPLLDAGHIEESQTKQPQFAKDKPKTRSYFKVPQPKEAAIDVARKEASQIEEAQYADSARAVAKRVAPQKEAPHRGNAGNQGFFKLAHGVFAEPLLRDLSGDCFRLFLWLSSRAWRYPTSNGVVRASVSYIELNAGMSHATISRGLKTLKEKGLISTLEVDFKNGNLWQVSAIACGYSNNDDQPPRNKVAQIEADQISDSSASKNDGLSLKTGMHQPQNERDLRSYKKTKKIKEGCMPVSIVRLPEIEQKVPDNLDTVLSSFEAVLGADEQKALINGFMSREYPHGFYPPMQVVRTLAAREWFGNVQDTRSSACGF